MSADPDIAEDADLFGKVVGDLQEGVAVSDDNEITGTLKWVSGYTGYSETASEQEGNYLALQFAADLPGGVITAALGDEEVEVDEDGIAVFRITDKATQTITVSAAYADFPDLEVTETYTLDGLTLEEEPTTVEEPTTTQGT